MFQLLILPTPKFELRKLVGMMTKIKCLNQEIA